MRFLASDTPIHCSMPSEAGRRYRRSACPGRRRLDVQGDGRRGRVWVFDSISDYKPSQQPRRDAHGVEFLAVTQTGGWASPTMVAHYFAKLDAWQGGAAKLVLLRNRK